MENKNQYKAMEWNKEKWPLLLGMASERYENFHPLKFGAI